MVAGVDGRDGVPTDVAERREVQRPEDKIRHGNVDRPATERSGLRRQRGCRGRGLDLRRSEPYIESRR
jgi:hypothetical protein